MTEARSQDNSEKSSLPIEPEYADDSDFPFESKEEAEHLKRIVKETLGERNLKVNDDKTEETFIIRERKKSDEKWRKTKKLGSLLGDYEDMRRREQLSNNAMAEVKKLWKKSKVSNKRKLQLYRTLVKTVLTYNFGTWGLTKKETETLDCIHRKQLRRISPNYRGLTNKQLYEECRERQISKDMKETRWRTFGHMLRLPPNNARNNKVQGKKNEKTTTQKEPSANNNNITVVLGDSHVKRLDDSKMPNVKSHGIGGLRSNQLVKRQDQQLSLDEPKAKEVILHVGVNDVATSTPKQIVDNFDDITERIKEKNPDVRITISSIMLRKDKTSLNITILKQICY